MDNGADLAVISGSGELPLLIKKLYKKATCIKFNNSFKTKDNQVINCQFERLGFLFEFLKQNEIRRVVMAGAITRPQLNESKMDEYTLNLFPKLKEKFVKGDNELLSFIASEFERKGYKVLGVADIIPELTVSPGFICGSPYALLSRDILKADRILNNLSSEDIGQGIVIENGLVLGIETLQGTNELLKFVTKTSSKLRINGLGGIFVKRPKVDQDLRFDMPAIGPMTIELACKAGLRGLVISPGSVLLLEKEKCIKIAQANNFFIFSQESSV